LPIHQSLLLCLPTRIPHFAYPPESVTLPTDHYNTASSPGFIDWWVGKYPQSPSIYLLFRSSLCLLTRVYHFAYSPESVTLPTYMSTSLYLPPESINLPNCPILILPIHLNPSICLPTKICHFINSPESVALPTHQSLSLEQWNAAVEHKHRLDAVEEQFTDSVEKTEKVGIVQCPTLLVSHALHGLVQPQTHILTAVKHNTPQVWWW